MKTTVRLSLHAASATALLAAPTNASAQVLPAALSGVGLAKSDAILGGAPSALAAIMARQSGQSAPAAQLASLIPAAYRVPMTSAVVRTESPLFAPAVLSGRPDVFGTVALTV